MEIQGTDKSSPKVRKKDMEAMETDAKMKFPQILSSILDIGEIMLVSGAEVNRVEDTMERIAAAYGCTRVDVFTITSSIVVTVQTGAGEIVTQTRRIQAYETDMDKLEKCNALSRRICMEPVPLDRLQEAVDQIRREKGYPQWIRLLTYGGVSLAFSVFFGGTAGDGAAAFLCGLLLYGAIKLCTFLRLQRIILNILCSAAVGLAAVALTGLGLGVSVDKIIIGNIMLLIPGLSLTTSLRDMISGDMISGLLGLCEAVLRALAIAVGFALVLWTF